MKEISRKITVDLSRRGGIRPTFAVQNDKGTRNLRISLTDDGLPYKVGLGTVAALNYKRPDGVVGALTAMVDDGDVCVTLLPPVIGVIGNTVCSVSLFGNKGNKLTSSEFSIDVCEEIYAGEALEESPEYTLLDGVFARLAGFEIYEAERSSAELSREQAEKERDEAENAREQAEIERDKRVNANLGVGGYVTLSADKWTQDITQSLIISGLRVTDLILFYPSSAYDRAILTNCEVYVSPDTDGEKVTASARVKPSLDISLRYFITRGKVSEEV